MLSTNVIKDKLRKKILYIVSLISFLIILIFSTGTATITINGLPITDFKNIINILLTFVNVIGGVLAIALSLSTIPKEYELKTSHLIWIRGIPQWKYHGQLALGNILISIISFGLLYLGIVFIVIFKGEYSYLIRIFPGFLISCISISIVSLFTSVISIIFSSFIAGIISISFFLIGTFHPLLDTLKSLVNGFVSSIIEGILLIIPDLNAIQEQGNNYFLKHTLDIHVILGGLLTLYLISVFLYIFRRKEA